ncbi:asparaginase [Halobacteroides halobius]|nr:asparaginase [Halobacteroides halobius]
MKKIKMITTGGTIAMGEDEVTHQIVPKLSGLDLLNKVPTLESMAQLELTQFSNVDSSQLTLQDILSLAQLIKSSLKDDEVSGVLITHGTDTLEETAYLLDLIIDTPKPIVLTGALRTFDQPSSDGESNLIHSLQAILEPASSNRGVLVVMNNQIHAARFLNKTHTNRLEAFSSLNCGPMGKIDYSGVHYFYELKPQTTIKIESLTTPIEIIKLGLGSSDNLIKTILDSKCQGLVIETFGLGTVPKNVMDPLKETKIPVMITSRCLEGQVYDLYGAFAGDREITKMNLIYGKNLTSVKARLLLTLLLGKNKSITEIREFINHKLKF